MKTRIKTTMLLLSLISSCVYGQRGIGTNTPNEAAILELQSTTKGFLMPRMNETERDLINITAVDVGLLVYCTDCDPVGVYVYTQPSYQWQVDEGELGSWTLLDGRETTIVSLPNVTVEVPSGSGGETLTFLRHNLGANYTLDPDNPVRAIHGNYYQWGRKEVVADASTTSPAITDWNTVNAVNGSWLDGIKTANDPCPSGFRVPTRANWAAVIANSPTVSRTGGTWSDDGNFGRALHFENGTDKLTLPVAGNRMHSGGTLDNRGNTGFYWSSSVTTAQAHSLYFDLINESTADQTRTHGFSVRCVKE